MGVSCFKRSNNINFFWIALLLISKSAFSQEECENYVDVGEDVSGVVFQYKDWYVKEVVSGKEWIGVDCVGYVYHKVLYACTLSNDNEFCVSEFQGRVNVEGVTQFVVDHEIFESESLNYNSTVSSVNSKENVESKSSWLRLLSGSKGMLFGNVNGRIVGFSLEGSSAALRRIGLIE